MVGGQVLLRGLRRGECWRYWSDVNFDAGLTWVGRSTLQLGGKIVTDTLKTEKSRRPVSLDPGSVQMLREHQAAQAGRAVRGRARV